MSPSLHIAIYLPKSDVTWFVDDILGVIAEIAVPIAAILLIVWLLRHWKK